MTISEAFRQLSVVQMMAALKDKDFNVGLSVYATGAKYSVCAHRKEPNGKTKWCNISIGFSSSEKALENKIDKLKRFVEYAD